MSKILENARTFSGSRPPAISPAHRRGVGAVLAALTLMMVFSPAVVGKPRVDFLARTVFDTSRTQPSGLPKQQQLSDGDPQEPSPKVAAQAVPSEPAVTKKPQVTYEGGELTIVAENSPLADVMKELRTVLGADIELPSTVAGQRIWVRLGPGPARRVLRDLLDGTEFNYVIQASEEDVDGIRSVLLTQRNKAAGASGSPGGQERAGNTKIPRGSASDEAADPEDLAKAESVASPDAPSADPSAAKQSQRDAFNQLSAAGNSSASTSGAGQPTTDQMVQQLQNMYEQRRQMQIRQNQKPPASNQ